MNKKKYCILRKSEIQECIPNSNVNTGSKTGSTKYKQNTANLVNRNAQATIEVIISYIMGKK